ncbi:hypothetical protein AMECASPLE_009348 [Ameca splendens]|uniref:Uncharacterized protein n=1 Tax=Ameca splendens TaxID=208324 RepID=A0ABV0YZM3_9TELE
MSVSLVGLGNPLKMVENHCRNGRYEMKLIAISDVPVSSCPDEGYSKLHSDCSLTCSRADLLYHLPPAAGH